MELNTLSDLLHEQLRDLYSAETQLVAAMPDMAERATNADLTKAFQNHLVETQNQVSRLEQIGADMGIELTGHTCKAMKGLIQEAKDMVKEDGNDAVIDAGLIAMAQRIEHYEIAAYGTARIYAKRLGQDMAENLLAETLDEEKATDSKLTGIAERVINPQAARA